MNTVFGVRLRELRLEKRLTQEQAAKIFNVSKTTICQWETIKQQPGLEELANIAIYFDVSTDYLLGLVDDFGVRISAPTSSDILTAEEKKYIENLRKLSPNLRQLMSETLDTMVAESRKNK